MRVCLLNRSEAKRLEEECVTPNCEHHTHIPFEKALEDVGDGVTGTLRWVTDRSSSRQRYVTVTTIVIGYSSRPSCERRGRGRASRVISSTFVMQAVGK